MKTSGLILMCDNASKSVKKKRKDLAKKDASSTKQQTAENGAPAVQPQDEKVSLKKTKKTRKIDEENLAHSDAGGKSGRKRQKADSVDDGSAEVKKLKEPKEISNKGEDLAKNDKRNSEGKDKSGRKRRKVQAVADSGKEEKKCKPSNESSDDATDSGKMTNKEKGADNDVEPEPIIATNGSKNDKKVSKSKEKKRKIRAQKRGKRSAEASKKVLDSLLSEDKHIVEEGSDSPENVPMASAEMLFACERYKDQDVSDANTSAKPTSETKPPKKKKKKKQEDTAEVPPTKTETDRASQRKQALSYLRLWKKDRENWSFKKVQQIWLIKNMYDPAAIKSKTFETLLDYLSGAKGSARTRLVEKAESVFEAVKSDGDVADDSSDNLTQPEAVTIERARQVLQVLSE